MKELVVYDETNDRFLRNEDPKNPEWTDELYRAKRFNLPRARKLMHDILDWHEDTIKEVSILRVQA